MRVAVLADTHLQEGIATRLPAEVLAALARADLLLHAGDLTTPAVLAELSALVETVAVCGNNDHGLAATLPETRLVDLDGIRTALVHDSGPRSGRAARLHQRFPDAELVVFGHSHLPSDELGIGGQRLFNPGSPTQRRRGPTRSMGWLRIEAGVLVEHRLVPLPAPSGSRGR